MARSPPLAKESHAMFATPFIRNLALAAACAAPALAGAETLYSQPYAETANGGYFASTPGGFLQYDSFALSQNATIESVSWYGVDLNELLNWTPVNPTSFTVTISADAGGVPGTQLSFSLIGDSAGATDTGIDLMGLNLYRFSGTLATPFQATAGTTYWIGISDPTTNANWFWASGGGADGVHMGVVGGVPSSFADDMSFTLQGTVGAVPEPASGALMLLGAAALAAARARRRVR
jgi:hypothetical protein